MADPRSAADSGATRADPGRRLAPVVRLAPAKLNLTLAILGLRPDGFHDLHSVMVRLALHDRLSVGVAAAGTDTLHVVGHDAGPLSQNLVLRAIAATREAVGRSAPTPPLAARLEKRIPVAAGLGGGSSDAAAAIDAALEAWGAELDEGRHAGIARVLGSDVPFFVAGPAALVEGRGERVTPLRGILGDPPGVVLVTPPVPASTPAVFAALDAGDGEAPSPGSTRLASEHLAAELARGLRAGDLLARAGVLASANDLVAAAAIVVPEIVALRRALMRRLGRPVGLSGSGPTLWALYPSFAAAEAAAAELREPGAAPAITTPSGPPRIIATALADGSNGRDAR